MKHDQVVEKKTGDIEFNVSGLSWSMAESNRRPRDCQSRALAN